MSEPTNPRLPSLLIVTGRPGAGKTTLAHELARTVRRPAVCRDELKEGYVHTTGITGEAADAPSVGRTVYAAFFSTIELLLTHHVSLVAEAAFQHKLWVPKLEPLTHRARVRIIVCDVDDDHARARRIARHEADPERARFHHDSLIEAARQNADLSIAAYEPPRMDVPTLTVDTSDGYQPDFDALVAFARADD